MIVINPFSHNQKSEPDLIFLKSLTLALSSIMNQQFLEKNDFHAKINLSKKPITYYGTNNNHKRDFIDFLCTEILWHGLT